MKKIIVSALMLVMTLQVFAQSTEIKPNQGISVPQFTTVFIDALTNQPKGTVVFDKDLDVMKYWNGTSWISLTTGGGSGAGWVENGVNLENTNAGNVGIGVASPTAKLAVVGTGPNGSLAITGGVHTSHFNYPASGLENTYIRGGNAGSHVLLNDSEGLGSVGIGTNIPYSKLDVNGDARMAAPALTYSNLFSDYLGGSLLLDNTTGDDAIMRLDANKIQSFASNLLGYSPNKLVLNPFGGNVGIGTNFMPEYKLHLYATGEQLVKVDGTNSIVAFHDRTSNAQYGFFRAWTSNPFNPASLYGFEIGTPPISGADPAKHLLFSTNYNIRMVIRDNGNIGIGTADPGLYKLAVNGSVRAKEIVVESTWADYVFDEKYQLRSIDEMEVFIKENKHLPNIPKASDIENNGLNVAKTNKAMMEKIEELALYIIQLKKEVDTLKAKN
ncbi:MAG: hypothetical protein ACOVO2_09440 [Emticicia sp.]|uniref:hypothetical protein n=1 Tax=Emticicia sp. TaxID=1930953 RepID=UPI003BA4EC5A